MKNIFCLCEIHKWKVIKKITAFNLLFLLKKHKGILKRSTFKLEKDYLIYDKECERCGKKDLNISDTKNYLEEMLIKNIKGKS